MPNINVPLTPEEYTEIMKVKGRKTWKQIIMEFVDTPVQTRLLYDVTNGFDTLTRTITTSILDGYMTGILERYRVCVIRILKEKDTERKEIAINVLEALMDGYIQGFDYLIDINLEAQGEEGFPIKTIKNLLGQITNKLGELKEEELEK
jgi:hypothetical protein